MMSAKRFLVAATLLLSACAAAEASPIVFLVRHAEKAATGGNDPDLSTAGQERAEALARMLKDAEITAIFTTEFKRTQETAAPTVKATQVTPTIVPVNDILGLVDKLRSLKGNALIVAHGNTIPDLVKALGIATPVNIPENDYSELLFIILGDKPQLLRLHYPM
jgi:2,3-bisphosphoglycerate-dependent phosphoglycerate mutase